MIINFASVYDIKAARRANEATPVTQAFACCMRGGVLLPGQQRRYFQTGLLLRLVAELAAVDALLADETPDRLDIREL